MNRRRRLALAAGLLVTLCAVAVAARAQTSGVLSAAKEQLADRDWRRAIQTLSGVAASEKGSPAGMEASFLLVKAALSANDHAAALDFGDKFLRAYPDSAYASKVRFLMADAYAGVRRWKDTAEIYRERTEFLTGEQYRLKLAQLYLEIADEAFEGVKSGREGDPLDPPKVTKDYPRAAQFYHKARLIYLPEPLLRKAQHRIATAAFELNNHAGAAAEWAQLLERWPDSDLAPEATYGLARAYLALGKVREGREMLERLEARFADHALVPLAVEALGASYPPNEKESLKKRLAHWKRFAERYPQHEAAPRVLYQSAVSLHQAGELEAAVKAYGEVLEKHPKHEIAPEAGFAIGQARLARQEYDLAREAWAQFLGRFPNHPRFVEAQRAIVQAAFQKGQDHFAASRFEAAEAAWREFLGPYPVDALAPRAQLMVGFALQRRGDWKKAVDEFAVCASKYRQSAEAAQAQLQVALIREREEKNLPEAIRQYEALVRTFPYAPEAAQARETVRAMKEKSLRVTSARAFATNEPFVLGVASRNVPKLKLKAYKLDLLEYFRKKHAVGGIEELAVEIVAPDKTWTDEVEGYEPYRLFERDMKLPLEGRGAYVVSCEEDEFRAVTLVLRSDITIIAKQGPQSMLVFAKDEVANAPAQGVHVLLSDGGSIVAEGDTGKDGVFQHKFDGGMGAVRVFAYRGKPGAYDVATTEVTPAAGTTWGYTTKAYLYTDRPVYRPGQKVFYRGILRRVESGLYQASQNLPVTVSIRDSKGVTLSEREMRTNAFGSFSGEIELGEEPPLGTYFVNARFEGTDFQGTFEVESYKKPDVLVEVEPARRDVLTGEEVKAVARLKYYFGGAVKNAPVRWSVFLRPYAFDAERYRKFAWFFAKDEGARGRRPGAGGRFIRQGEGTTDQDGKLEIAFETEAGDDDRIYAIEVEAQDPSRRWVGGGANVFVTAKAFYAVLSLDKKVYRPGEPIRATAIAVDPGHRGVEAKGEVVLYRRLPSGGEDPVARQPLTTGADGRANVEVKAPRPGEYRLVFAAQDRRGGLVEGGAPLVVAGEAEDLAKEAKLIAEREVYNRGETAQVLLNSPAAPAWALVTFEGEKVLDYRVIPLLQRSTTIQVEMADAYSPNVFMRVAIPVNHQLYESGDEVAVLKFLKLSVAPEKPTVKPGEKLKWNVEAVDHAGRPVEAEFSLAVVDASIYAIKPDMTPPIQPFFYDQKRQLAVATRSSYEWRYDGVTARLAAELLAELERRQTEADDAEQDQALDERTRAGRELMKSRRMEQEGAGAALDGAKVMRPPAPAPASAAPAEPMGEAGLRDKEAKDEAAAGPRGGAKKNGGGAGGGRQAAARVRRTFADTAFWTAHVVTGADGKAVVEVGLPDNLTTWRATVRGATRDTLVGSAEAEATATQKVLVRLETPRFATQGDSFTLATLAHNYSGAALAIEEALKAEGAIALDGAPPAGKAEIGAGDVRRTDRGARAPKHGTALLRADALSDVESDAVEQSLLVLPHGVKERQATSGAVTGGEAFWRFEIPEGAIEGTERLTLRLTPTVSTAIVDALVYLDAYPYGCIEQTVNRFLPAVATKRALERLGIMNEAARRDLAEAVERGIVRLANAQNPDGGWGWWPSGGSQPAMTALALAGLEVARDSGSYVDPSVLNRGRQSAQNLLRAVGEDQTARAALLRALALSKHAPQDELGRALRAVDELTARAAADLALACADMDRPEMASRAVARVRAIAEGGWKAPPVRHPFYGGADEAAAYTVLALLRFDPQSPLVEAAIEFLMGRRGGDHWRSTRETGAVVLALGAYLEARGVAEADSTVAVWLDGKKFAETSVRGGAADRQKRILTIGRPELTPGKHDLRITKEGSGNLRYTIVVEAVRAAVKIPAAGNLIAVTRKYVRWIPPVPERDQKGRPLTPGWSVLDPSARPGFADEEPLSELASGERVVVRVAVTLREPVAYAIVEDRLPAGLEPLSDGAIGAYERYEARDDRVAFFASALGAGTHVFSYAARAQTPGEFAALPAEAYPMYEPEVFGRSEGARLSVREKPLKPREPTPDEIYAQALELAEQGKLDEARPLVERLLAMKLMPEPRERLMIVLLDIHLAAKDARAVVKTFEALQDLNPRASAERSRDARVGRGLAAAYQGIGDDERAVGFLRELVAKQFRQDAEVADVYASLRRELGAQDYLRDLYRRYPDADYVIDGWYRVARKYYDLDRPATTAKKEPRHYQSGRSKKMHEEAYGALKEFIAFQPRSVHCDDAQYYAALSMFQLEQWELAALEAEQVPRRYPDSEYVDDALYHATLARFTEKKWDQALATGEKVLAYRVRRGQHQEPSPFVPQVQHLFAKIFHLRGDLARAVQYYGMVAGSFEDARDTLALFTAKEVKVPEIVSLPPGKVEVPVRFKNMSTLKMKLYPVDLLLLFAKEKDLAQVSQVDLSGIVPRHEIEHKLAGKPYEWNDARVPLPLTEKGVYLAVAKADDQDASALVILSEIDLQIQRLADKVRVYVVTRKDGKPAADTFVTVSDGSRIIGRGRTDARGVFEARLSGGAVSVVAERDGHYALYREGQED